MRAYFKEASAIKRDKIAGDAAFLLKRYLPPKGRMLRLPDVKGMFDEVVAACQCRPYRTQAGRDRKQHRGGVGRPHLYRANQRAVLDGRRQR